MGIISIIGMKFYHIVLTMISYKILRGLSEEQLNCSYRPEGWTIRQVVHHFADSHINGYVRFRLALTEDCPIIKPYDEVQWAELEDAVNMPVDVSLRLVESLHKRWVRLIRSLTSIKFDSEFQHLVSET